MSNGSLRETGLISEVILICNIVVVWQFVVVIFQKGLREDIKQSNNIIKLKKEVQNIFVHLRCISIIYSNEDSKYL